MKGSLLAILEISFYLRLQRSRMKTLPKKVFGKQLTHQEDSWYYGNNNHRSPYF